MTTLMVLRPQSQTKRKAKCSGSNEISVELSQSSGSLTDINDFSCYQVTTKIYGLLDAWDYIK